MTVSALRYFLGVVSLNTKYKLLGPGDWVLLVIGGLLGLLVYASILGAVRGIERRTASHILQSWGGAEAAAQDVLRDGVQ